MSVHLEAASTAPAPVGGVTFVEAITAALRDALRDDPRVFLLGEDIGHFGGGPDGAEHRHTAIRRALTS